MENMKNISILKSAGNWTIKVLLSLYKVTNNYIYGIREVMKRKIFFQEENSEVNL